MKQHLPGLFAMAATLTSCGAGSTDSKLKAEWDRSNEPHLIVGRANLETNFDKLPGGTQVLSSYEQDELWSGDYWPTYRGGITYRWNQGGNAGNSDRYSYSITSENKVDDLSSREISRMSPAEKYDIFIGNYNFPLTRFERNRTQVLTRDDIPKWEGICHSWAPATLAYKNPSPVTLTNRDGIDVHFGSSDIKALLSFFLHYEDAERTYFMGKRCNIDFSGMSNREIEKASRSNPECRDTNAGSFHLVLTNQIGLLDKGFIADVTRDLEVWNQAIVAYDTKELGRKRGASSGAAPGTVEEVTIETIMYYISEIGQTQKRVSIKDSGVATKSYKYRVELDRRGNVIGGEWLTTNRPDFLWKQDIADFQGFFAPLEEVYNASIR